jgi:hypothetical protein
MRRDSLWFRESSEKSKSRELGGSCLGSLHLRIGTSPIEGFLVTLGV